MTNFVGQPLKMIYPIRKYAFVTMYHVQHIGGWDLGSYALVADEMVRKKNLKHEKSKFEKEKNVL